WVSAWQRSTWPRAGCWRASRPPSSKLTNPSYRRIPTLTSAGQAMRTTPCVKTDRLAALLQHEVSDEDAELFAHLETCTSCCQTLTDLAAERSLREEIARNLPQVESQARSAHPLALERVMAQLKAEAPAPCSD